MHDAQQVKFRLPSIARLAFSSLYVDDCVACLLDTTLSVALVNSTPTPNYYAPPLGALSDTAIRPSVRLSVPTLGRAAALGYSCSLAMRGLRTRPQTGVDPPRVELPSAGGISSRRPRCDNFCSPVTKHKYRRAETTENIAQTSLLILRPALDLLLHNESTRNANGSV